MALGSQSLVRLDFSSETQTLYNILIEHRLLLDQATTDVVLIREIVEYLNRRQHLGYHEVAQSFIRYMYLPTNVDNGLLNDIYKIVLNIYSRITTLHEEGFELSYIPSPFVFVYSKTHLNLTY